MQIMTLVDPATGQVTKVWDGRKTMRTLADALAKLRELGALADNGQAEICAVPIGLPDGSIVATVAVIASHTGSSWRIMMPASAHFTARDTLGTRHRYEIDRLDGAITDPDGNVQPPHDSHVHAVELEPVRLTERLTTEQEKILHHVIMFLGAEKRCYRSVHEESLPGLVALDYAAVAQLGAERLPSLKAIERYVSRQLPGVSRQTLANVLALSGLRRPRSGPRARPRPSRKQTATISPQSA